MPSPIEEYLKDFGPAVSSQLAAYLVDAHGVPATTARKQISRANGSVRRLNGIVFPHKARFLYLDQQFGSPWYWNRLVEALIETRSAYGYALAALRQRGGIVPVDQFAIVCGAPIKQARQLSPATILTRLSAAGLLKTVTVPGVGDCVALVQADGHYESASPLMQARFITEEVLLTAIKDWLKKLGIVSYGKVAVRSDDELPKVGTFVWDLSAPSYLGHMVKQGADGKSKPGFVACDVCIGDEMTVEGVQPFLRKCVTLRSLGKVGPCMQIFVANRYTHEAFTLLKQFGVIPATPASLFGDEVAEGLSQLTSVLHKAALSVIDPDQFDQLFNKLGKIEGAAIQLRGTLFEYLAADIARRTIAPNVTMNRMFKVKELGEAEGDVVAVVEDQRITVIECKGYSPWGTIPDDIFKRWLRRNVKVFYRAIKDHPDWKNYEVRFEFWTTGSLSAEMLDLFDTARQAVKSSRYTLGLRRAPDVHQLCKAAKNKGLLTAYEKHFMKVEKDPVPPEEQEGLFY